MAAKADDYISETAQIPIFAKEDGTLCDIAKVCYHCLGFTPTEIQEKDELFRQKKLIV